MIPRRRPAAPLRRLEGRVSRRGLLGAGVLAGVLAASGVPLQARTRGGTLRLALVGPLPDGPGPSWRQAPAVLAQGAVYDTLTSLGPTGELRGELATAWESSPDARLWHLTLRRDVAFHDGRPLRAADVAASLLAHHRGRAAWALSRMEGVEPQGPFAVLVRLAEPDPDLPLLLTEPRLLVAPEGRFDGTGSGLYRLAGAPGPDRIRLERVEAHWKDGRAGWFDAMEALRLPRPRDRLDALLSGEADVAADLPAPLVAEARAAGVQAVVVPGNRQIHVALPRDAAHGLQPQLPTGVDRAAQAARWGGTTAADHPLGLLQPAFDPDILPPAQDPRATAAIEGVGLSVRAWDGCPTEDATFRKALSEGPWAPIRRHPGLLAALGAARRAEGEERRAAYARAQAICASTGIAVVAAHAPYVTLHAPTLAHGEAVSPFGPFDGGRLPERWWFA